MRCQQPSNRLGTEGADPPAGGFRADDADHGVAGDNRRAARGLVLAEPAIECDGEALVWLAGAAEAGDEMDRWGNVTDERDIDTLPRG